MKASTRGFDAEGMTTGRLFRQHMLSKVRPLWCFSAELEAKHLLALAIRHHLGYPIAYLTTRYQSQWQGVLLRWRRMHSKMNNTEQ